MTGLCGAMKDVVFKPMPVSFQGHQQEGVPDHPLGDGQEWDEEEGSQTGPG